MAEAKFEKNIEKLEAIVEKLEEGGLSLDDSLKQFEEGIMLTARCEKALSHAEKKIEMLVKGANGKLETQPFGDEESAEEPAVEPEVEPEADMADDSPQEELPF